MTLKEFYNKYLTQIGIIPNIPGLTAEYLNLYFSNRVAMDAKTLTKYGSLIMADDDYTNINNTIIACVLQNNQYKWPKLYETMFFDYNPIWNYDGTNTKTYSEHITTDNIGARNVTSTAHVVPFDSDTESETGKDVNSSESATDTHTSGVHTETETKGGNQGTTSTQSMIGQERDIVNFNFLDAVLSDVIAEITIPKYDNNEEMGDCYGIFCEFIHNRFGF